MSKDCCAAESVDITKDHNKTLRRVFTIVLGINLLMFFVELGYGYLSQSSALLADSLDMLGDTLVYALTLFVIGKSERQLATSSLMKGIIMAMLGLFVLFQTIYKILVPALPHAETMTIIGLVAMAANLICFALLWHHKNADLNTRSAWICSRNDVTANISVIIAGLLVGYFQSIWPDIIVSLAITFLVLYSSAQIIYEAWGKIRKLKTN